jgi:nitrogenase molybdenum-iron protein alpha/beta subunit
MDVLRRNNVTVTGDGPATMILAHGYGCDQTMWNLIRPHFESTHRVVAHLSHPVETIAAIDVFLAAA